MKRILIYMTTISLLTFASLASGSPTHAQDNGLPSGMAGTEWKLLEIQRSTQDILSTANTNVTLTFDTQGLAKGNSPCNKSNEIVTVPKSTVPTASRPAVVCIGGELYTNVGAASAKKIA